MLDTHGIDGSIYIYIYIYIYYVWYFSNLTPERSFGCVRRTRARRSVSAGCSADVVPDFASLFGAVTISNNYFVLYYRTAAFYLFPAMRTRQ